MREQVRGLIDTGAILALLDADDSWHRQCVEAFSSLKLPLATTAAVNDFETYRIKGKRKFSIFPSRS